MVPIWITVFVAEDCQQSQCQQDGTDRRRIGQHEDHTVGLGHRLLRSRDHGNHAGLEGKRLCRGSVINRDDMADRLESFGDGSTQQTGSQQAMVMERLAFTLVSSGHVWRGSGGWHAGPCQLWRPQR